MIGVKDMTAVMIVTTIGIYSLVMKHVLNHVSKPNTVQK